MRFTSCLILAVGATVLAAAPSVAQSVPYETSDDMRRVPVPPVDRSHLPALIIQGATLLDGYGKAPVSDSLIIIRGNRIMAAGPASKVTLPTDVARTIDAKGMWVMPGMIDMHIHVANQRGTDAGSYPNSESAIGMRASQLGASLVKVGITTVVDRGTPGDVALRMKEAVARGLMIGPRVFWSGALITTTGGHSNELTGTATGKWLPDVPHTGTVTADGPWEWRKAVRVQIRKQADVIKAAAPYTREEIAAAVDEAHLHGLKVGVDTFGEFTIWAIEAGADSIEHPLDMKPDQVKLMAKYNTGWDPTLIAFTHLFEFGYPSLGIPKGGFYYTFSRRFPFDFDDIFKKIGEAYRANVRIGVGTDIAAEHDVLYPKAYYEELELLHKAGMPTKAVLASATRVGADILGMSDKLGTIEADKLADLLLLSRNPEEDLENLKAVKFVVANGKVVRGD